MCGMETFNCTTHLHAELLNDSLLYQYFPNPFHIIFRYELTPPICPNTMAVCSIFLFISYLNSELFTPGQSPRIQQSTLDSPTDWLIGFASLCRSHALIDIL